MAVDLTETVPAVDEKQQFLGAYERECAITMKLLKSYPASEGDFRAHPRSMSARELAFMFTAEAGAGMAALSDTLKATGQIPPPPPTMADVIASFEQASQAMRSAVSNMSPLALQSTIVVPAGKGVTAEVRKLDFLWLMLNDQIHHRGQLSVYTRMAGGKVPSMYGPSGDEPWF